MLIWLNLRAAVGRKVFIGTGNNTIEIKHRTIAEFVAARHLASKCRSGLPLSRVMALMTGFGRQGYS
jgi:hypothetical protein